MAARPLIRTGLSGRGFGPLRLICTLRRRRFGRMLTRAPPVVAVRLGLSTALDGRLANEWLLAAAASVLLARVLAAIAAVPVLPVATSPPAAASTPTAASLARLTAFTFTSVLAGRFRVLARLAIGAIRCVGGLIGLFASRAEAFARALAALSAPATATAAAAAPAPAAPAWLV